MTFQAEEKVDVSDRNRKFVMFKGSPVQLFLCEFPLDPVHPLAGHVEMHLHVEAFKDVSRRQRQLFTEQPGGQIA